MIAQSRALFLCGYRIIAILQDLLVVLVVIGTLGGIVLVSDGVGGGGYLCSSVIKAVVIVIMITRAYTMCSKSWVIIQHVLSIPA